MSRWVGGRRDDSCYGVDEEGFITMVLYPSKRRHFDAVKKLNLIEPIGSSGSSGPIPVQSNSGLIDRTGPKP